MLIPVSTLFKVPMWSAGCIEIHTENPETLVWFARSPAQAALVFAFSPGFSWCDQLSGLSLLKRSLHRG